MLIFYYEHEIKHYLLHPIICTYTKPLTTNMEGISMLGSILKPIINLAVKCGAVVISTIFLAGLAIIPLLHASPLTPQIMKTVGAGAPVLLFGAGFAALVFAKEWRVLKYTLPLGLAIPTLIYLVSFIFEVPAAISAMRPLNLLSLFLLLASGTAIIVDMFTGKLSGDPWIYKLIGNKYSSTTLSEDFAPVAASASTTSIDIVGAFEVVEIPEEYVIELQTPNPRFWEPFRNILRAMMAAGIPLGIRLEKIQGVLKLYYLTFGMNAKSLQGSMDLLQRFLNSMLPKFRFKRHDRFKSLKISGGITGTLRGEILTIEDTRQRADPLTVVAESMAHMQNGVLQVYALPVSPGIMRSFRRRMTNREYRSTMQKSQHTISTRKDGLFSSGGEASSVIVDIDSSTKADKLYRKYQRQSIEHACNTEITVACWGTKTQGAERDARLLLEVMKSTLVPDDPTKDLKVQMHRRDELVWRVISGRPIGQLTLLTPEETAMLFTIARCDLGIVLSRRQTFSTATNPLPSPPPSANALVPTDQTERRLVYSEWKHPNHNAIFLGNPIGANGYAIAGRFIWFHPQKFESHLIILGNTRSGKTTTAISVVAQAMKCGVKVQIIVPMRASDWLPLMHLFPDSFWIVKVGDNSKIPLRINMFNPPPGVTTAAWILGLGDIMSSWMPNDRVMRMHLDDVLHATYRNCDWDYKTDKKGRPILLNDFWDAVEEVCLDIPYGNEVKQNFFGAIYSRVSNLLRNRVLVEIYNTEEGITWEQIANNNILFNLEDIPTNEDRAFCLGLISTGLHLYKKAHATKRVTNLLVLEEASYALKRPEGPDHYGHDSSTYVVNRIVEILTTGGGNGLGMLILEQIPSRLAPAVFKLIVNTIVHALGEESERLLVAGHIGIDEKQSEHLHQLGKGETLVFLEGEGTTRSVKIQPLNMYLDFPLPDRKITESEIIAHMTPVYEKYPGFTKLTELPQEVIDRIERAKPSATASPEQGERVSREQPKVEVVEKQDIHEFLDHHIRDIVQNPRFVNSLVERMEAAKGGDVEPLVNMVRDVIDEFQYKGVRPLWLGERLLTHTNKLYPSLLSEHLMTTAMESLQKQLA